ncbi:hypothetical protein H490_0102395 [Leucobacter sp. UCD-THU]|uniref:DUF6414 family protein n=1 Tax=Leucobacter sp. UCD-THU TaxID=1292023 RepID=UPI00036EB640|nr:hypothetical protein [Leucobacter sp. UCD-THU]EYT56398.1 hypothetical protein H490_0102395 [Leucobacter sp. UCD-THU]
MSVWNKMKSLFHWKRRDVSTGTKSDLTGDVLREFVYLDEVSVRSLLSSQKGGVTDSTSEQKTSGRQAEIEGSVSVEPGFLTKAEVTSRYQTSNSSTVQTSRKATVQSWFRELLAIPDLRFIQPVKIDSPVDDPAKIKQEGNQSRASRSLDFQRGSVVEFRVKLSADPVFHLGTMVSEFTGMAEDYPEMFAADNGLATLREVQPINKILQRLLAGLIPIRAEAIDYSVVEIDGEEFVVHNDLLTDLELDRKPLVIVGVTEHLAYWKDLRRVLFSDAEFTVLCRVSRDGLQRTWTPVKLADLFRPLVPKLVDQINAAGRVPFVSRQTSAAAAPVNEKMVEALSNYKTALLGESDAQLNAEQSAEIELEIAALQERAGSAYEQRTAFALLREKIRSMSGVDVEASTDLELREQARQASGLPLLPLQTSSIVQAQASTAVPDIPDERLLDVDVIAIYW